MSHRYKTRAPSTAMYRHFAAITVVATLMIALFAEDQPALAVSSGGEPAPAAAEPPQPKAAPSPAQQPGGVWGTDSDDAGLRALTAPGSIASFAPAGLPDLSARFAPDYLERLSDEERAGLLQAMAENGVDGTQLARSQASALERDSRRRSGSSGRE